MHKTKHVKARMSQRAINKELIDLVLNYGNPEADGKVVLNKKTLKALCAALDHLKKTALNALKKGGVVVVEEGEVLLTTYRLDSFDKRKSYAS